MKRLMTTLIFVLLGWTGLCLADGVTVSGKVNGGSLNGPIWEAYNIFLLDNTKAILYTGSVTENSNYETVYSFTDVVPGNYTLRFEGCGSNKLVIHEESIEVQTEAIENKEIALVNSDMLNGTHRAVQFVVVQEGGTTAIAGATVTGTPSTEGAKAISLISDKDGKVTFFFEQAATLSLTAKATAYEDKTLTFSEEFSIPNWLTKNVQIAMKAAPIEAVTLSGNITMVPAGDFPADFQLQLTNIRHEYSQTTPANNRYSFENVPVGDGPSKLEVYDPTATNGYTDEYTVTTPNDGRFLITNASATFTQDITITKVYARVKGTIKDVATLGSTLPTITLTKEGQTSYSYSAQATEGGKFTIKRVSAGTYTVGTTLAGYAVKNAPKVTITDNLADFTLSDPLEFEEADVEITFKKNDLGFRANGDYLYLNGAVVKLFAKGADVATATPLATATADAMGKFELKTTGKLGTEYILYVTHEKIKPCSLEVTATKATMTGNDLDFQFELAPVAIPTPTFTPNRGNVKPGATIAFTLPESLDIENDYNDMAFILYVENNATVELKSDVATLWNAIAGDTGGEPMAEGAEGDETEPSATLPFKVGMYREGEWAIPVSLSADASGAVVLRAVLAVSEDMNTLLYSNEMTATYTVEGEAVKPTAPTFYVDGEAVEAAAAEIAADAVVTLKNGYEEDEAEARLNPIYYKLNGTDADFEISDATVLTAEGFDALTIYNAGSEIAIDKDMTIKAATAHIDAIAKTVTWSDITTVAFTVTGGGDTDPELPETVAKPTFSVAAGPVDKGTKLTWTWDEAYDEYPMVGVVYVANGKDEDLNITADDFEGLYAELVEIEEGSAREDGKVYLYMSEKEGICTITKDMTVKARLAVLVYDETNEEVEVKMALSPVETVAYTVKGGTTEPEKDTVATPTFNPAAGEVAKGTKVTVACATDSVKIYYTVDGSEPTAASTEYTAAIEINEALTIKAIAIKGETKSAVASAAYTVKVANEELALAGVSVYPNPSDGEFQLDLPVAATVEVFASTGVLRQRVEAGAGVMTLNIDRSGIYFLRITADGRTTVKRVVVR